MDGLGPRDMYLCSLSEFRVFSGTGFSRNKCYRGEMRYDEVVKVLRLYFLLESGVRLVIG